MTERRRSTLLPFSVSRPWVVWINDQLFVHNHPLKFPLRF